jgi:glyoxylate reductase
MPTAKPLVMADLPLPGQIARLLEPHVHLVGWQEGLRDDTAGLYTYGHPAVTSELLERLPGLVVISNHGVGVDHIDVEAARQRGIAVGNTPQVLDGAVADLAFALLLASARRVVVGHQMATAGIAGGANFLGTEVHGSTLGIIGLGRIGRQIAHRAHGFGMQCLYHNRNRNLDAETQLSVTYASLTDLLALSDFVMVAVPLTEQTVGLIDEKALAAMKPTGTIINISRGAVVNTTALTEALKQGRIAAAALDVTDPEPLPSDHPLCSMPNVTLTPHVGSATVATREKMAEISVENLLLGLRCQPLIYHV